MDINEINQYLETSSNNNICISRQILKNYNKKVRDAIIKTNNEVLIEFNDYSFDEGGLYIKFIYENQSILIASL